MVTKPLTKRGSVMLPRSYEQNDKMKLYSPIGCRLYKLTEIERSRDIASASLSLGLTESTVQAEIGSAVASSTLT